MTDSYCVYWVHDTAHSNPYHQGYVGITANFEYRIRRYKQPGQRSHLYEKFQAGADVKVLARGLNQFEALVLEKKLRPARNIGWNKNSGGFMPPIPPSAE